MKLPARNSKIKGIEEKKSRLKRNVTYEPLSVPTQAKTNNQLINQDSESGYLVTGLPSNDVITKHQKMAPNLALVNLIVDRHRSRRAV